jgi:hypothetical protein
MLFRLILKDVPAVTAGLFILTINDVELNIEQVEDTEHTQVLVPRAVSSVGSRIIILEFAISVLADVKVKTKLAVTPIAKVSADTEATVILEGVKLKLRVTASTG